MKKPYAAPRVEIERYELSASLASCLINFGPTLAGHSGPVCGDTNIGNWTVYGQGTYFYADTNICTIETDISDRGGLQQNFPNTFSS